MRNSVLIKWISKCFMKNACDQSYNYCTLDQHAHCWIYSFSLSIPVGMQTIVLLTADNLYHCVCHVWHFLLLGGSTGCCCNSCQTKWAPASGRPHWIWFPSRDSSLCSLSTPVLAWQPGWCKTKPHVDSFLLIKSATHPHRRTFPPQLTIFTV